MERGAGRPCIQLEGEDPGRHGASAVRGAFPALAHEECSPIQSLEVQ